MRLASILFSSLTSNRSRDTTALFLPAGRFGATQRVVPAAKRVRSPFPVKSTLSAIRSGTRQRGASFADGMKFSAESAPSGRRAAAAPANIQC